MGQNDNNLSSQSFTTREILTYALPKDVHQRGKKGKKKKQESDRKREKKAEKGGGAGGEKETQKRQE